MRIVPGSQVADEELVAQVRETRSETAFRELHRRHTPRLLALARRMLGRAAQDAEDLVQDTWIRALSGLASFRGESRFGTWLVGIAVHVVQDHLRANRRVFLELDPATTGGRATPVAERVDLERVISRLPNGYRTVLLLHDLEGFTHAEIGRMLGVAEGTSKSQLNAARRQAQALFEGRVGLGERAGEPSAADATSGGGN